MGTAIGAEKGRAHYSAKQAERATIYNRYWRLRPIADAARHFEVSIRTILRWRKR